MGEQMELPILMLVKSDYAKLNKYEQHLIAVAYLTEPRLSLLKNGVPPTRNLKDAEKHKVLRKHKVKLEAAVANLLKQGWLVRTMTDSVTLTKGARKVYEDFLEELCNTGQMW